MLTPVHLHIQSNSSATHPVVFAFNHGMLALPSKCINWFICPLSPSENISRNNIPEITTDVSAGMYMITFHTPFALVRRLSISTASIIGMGISKSSVRSIYSTLLNTAVLKNLSEASFW